MKNTFDISGEIVRIIVIRKDGYRIPVLISPESLERAQEFPNSWCVMWCPKKNGFYCCGKMQTSTGRKSILLHRWLMPEAGENYVDHINGVPLDNRLSNLRVVAPAENSQNRMGAQTNSRSGVRGVSWYARKQAWSAALKIGKTRKHIGYFKTIDEAIAAVQEARKTHMPFSKEANDASLKYRH